jgi:hypothetical protein
MIKIIDNFFNVYSKDYYTFAKQLTFYEADKYKELTGHKNVDFPGRRTLQLSEVSPFFYLNIVNNVYDKFNLKLDNNAGVYCHVRFENDRDDWIHTDKGTTILIFLSETNLESGTTFYDSNDNLTDDIGFIHNRAVMFNGSIRHMSKKNYGTSIENGRLTINIFIEHD